MILILSATKRLNTKGVVVELRSRKNVLVGELITMKFVIAITLIVMVKVSHSFSLSLRKPSCFISLSFKFYMTTNISLKSRSRL